MHIITNFGHDYSRHKSKNEDDEDDEEAEDDEEDKSVGERTRILSDIPVMYCMT